MKRLEAKEILVNDRLNGKRENTLLLRRALLELKENNLCDGCRSQTDGCELRVYRCYDQPFNNCPENLKLLCTRCISSRPRQHWKKPSRPNMSFNEQVSDEIMKVEDRHFIKEIRKISK